MGDDIASPLERTAVDRCGEGIIHDEWHTMLVSHLSETLDIEDIAARVGDSLAKEALGILLEACLYLLVTPVWVYKGALDAEFLHRHAKKVVRATIYRIGSNEVVTCLTDIEDSVEVGCLTRTGQHSPYSTLQSAYFLRYLVIGGVSQTGVEISRVLQVKETRHLV